LAKKKRVKEKAKEGVKPKREATKRQLARWQQQKRRQRIILIAVIAVIASALGVVGGNWYTNYYQRVQQTVIRVNDQAFNMGYYIKMLKYYGGDAPATSILMMADEVTKAIEQNELVKQEAEKLGVTVSNDEVDEESKNYDPPLSKDYRDVVRVRLLIGELYDGYFDRKVPVSAEQRHIMAMLLESENQAAEVRTRLESGENFAELAGELSLESVSKASGGDFGWRPKDALTLSLGTSVLDDYAFSSEIGALSQPLYDETITKSAGYWLVKVSERDEEAETAHVTAILLGSEGEAQEVKARLEAGEGFADLAKELSQHAASKANGGDMGQLTAGMMPAALEEFVFSCELDTLSLPIRDDTANTKEGYWLVKMVGIDSDREIEASDRNLLKAELLDEWVSSLLDNPDNEVESYLDDEMKAWAVEQAVGG